MGPVFWEVLHGSVQTADRYSLAKRIAGLFVWLRFGLREGDKTSPYGKEFIAKKSGPTRWQEHSGSSVGIRVTRPWLHALPRFLRMIEVFKA